MTPLEKLHIIGYRNPIIDLNFSHKVNREKVERKWNHQHTVYMGAPRIRP